MKTSNQSRNIMLSLLLLIGVSTVSAYPNHAECKINFYIPVSCDQVQTSLVNQISVWDKSSSCPGDCHLVTKRRGAPLVPTNFEGSNTECTACPCGQKCLYQLTSAENNLIKGSHFTPVIKYEDEISFRLESDSESSCKVLAFSTATLSYAYFDFGTNYCNLRNLLDGSGLSSLPGFSQKTNEDICMQLDEINCAKY